MNMTKKILIIHTIIIGSFLLGIGGVLAKEGCTSDDQCKEKNPKKPYCTAPGPISKDTQKFCNDTALRRPGAQRPCNETLEPQKPTRPSPETPRPSLPAIEPANPSNNSFIDLRFSCAIEHANFISKLALQYCLQGGTLPECINKILSKELKACTKIPDKTQASIFDALWNFVTHRK